MEERNEVMENAKELVEELIPQVENTSVVPMDTVNDVVASGSGSVKKVLGISSGILLILATGGMIVRQIRKKIKKHYFSPDDETLDDGDFTEEEIDEILADELEDEK